MGPVQTQLQVPTLLPPLSNEKNSWIPLGTSKRTTYNKWKGKKRIWRHPHSQCIHHPVSLEIHRQDLLRQQELHTLEDARSMDKSPKETRTTTDVKQEQPCKCPEWIPQEQKSKSRQQRNLRRMGSPCKMQRYMGDMSRRIHTRPPTQMNISWWHRQRKYKDREPLLLLVPLDQFRAEKPRIQSARIKPSAPTTGTYSERLPTTHLLITLFQ